MNELTTIQPNVPANIDLPADTALVRVSDSLRQGLGTHADSHVALVNDLLATAPAMVQRDLLQSGLFSKPHVVAWVVALMDNDVEGINDAADIEREIRKIEAMIGNHSSPYWRGPDSARIQARYRMLIGSR